MTYLYRAPSKLRKAFDKLLETTMMISTVVGHSGGINRDHILIDIMRTHITNINTQKWHIRERKEISILNKKRKIKHKKR